MKTPIVVIGSGLAGFGIARALRRRDAQCELIMICADSGDNYSKPQLSTALANKKTAGNLVLNSADEMAKQLGMRFITHTRVTGIDQQTSQVITHDGQRISYGSLVLALGSDARKLKLEGDGAGEVMSVNSLNDYHCFQSKLRGKKSVLVIGGGLIGCEFANDLLVSGVKVKLVESCTRLLNVLVPAQVSEKLESTLQANGAQIHLARCVSQVSVSENGFLVQLDNGETLGADLVLSAVGVEPNVGLARDHGLKVNRGIVVDRYLQTSAKNIYAIGDCCEVEGRVLPYVAPIVAGSTALAATLTGEPTEVVYGAMPIAIKTTLFPLAASPVPLGANGHWSIQTEDSGIKALFEKTDGQLVGMALGGSTIKFRAELNKRLPSLMPARVSGNDS
mgnify:CR=1 FL=1